MTPNSAELEWNMGYKSQDYKHPRSLHWDSGDFNAFIGPLCLRIMEGWWTDSSGRAPASKHEAEFKL
jgi:hypothetical protein